MTTKLTSKQILHAGSPLNTLLDQKVEIAASLTTTWDPAAVSALGNLSQTFTVTGAQLGDFVHIGFTQNLAGLMLTGYVSSANNVTLVLFNPTGSTVNIASGTLKLRLTRS